MRTPLVKFQSLNYPGIPLVVGAWRASSHHVASNILIGLRGFFPYLESFSRSSFNEFKSIMTWTLTRRRWYWPCRHSHCLYLFWNDTTIQNSKLEYCDSIINPSFRTYIRMTSIRQIGILLGMYPATMPSLCSLLVRCLAIGVDSEDWHISTRNADQNIVCHTTSWG